MLCIQRPRKVSNLLRGFQISLILSSMRSEERRVGKECRSLCDWSSDVCSSDLTLKHLENCYDAMHPAAEKSEQSFAWFSDIPHPLFNEIGRASCRERV